VILDGKEQTQSGQLPNTISKLSENLKKKEQKIYIIEDELGMKFHASDSKISI